MSSSPRIWGRRRGSGETLHLPSEWSSTAHVSDLSLFASRSQSNIWSRITDLFWIEKKEEKPPHFRQNASYHTVSFHIKYAGRTNGSTGDRFEGKLQNCDMVSVWMMGTYSVMCKLKNKTVAVADSIMTFFIAIILTLKNLLSPVLG